MKSVSSVFPLVLIVAGCTQHTETQVMVERITVPDSYVLHIIVRDPLKRKSSQLSTISTALPHDKNHMKIGHRRSEEQARRAHEFYGPSLVDFIIELVDYRFDSTDSVSGQLIVERQYPYRAHWSLPICFTVGSSVKRTLEAPRQEPVTMEFWLKDTAEVAAFEPVDTRR